MNRAFFLKQRWYAVLMFIILAGIISIALFEGISHQEEPLVVQAYDEPVVDFFKISNPTQFSLPEGLKPQVDFWKKIFTEYTSEQIVIHDRRHLKIIYGVIDLNKRHAYSRKSRKKTIRLAEKKYRRILRKLKKLKPGNMRTLSEEERKIYKMLKEVPGNYSISRANRNIRIQYGMKNELRKALVKSTPYLKEMERIFVANGLPAELTRLPFIESSFNVEAYSLSGAAGIWQFTRPTGKIYLSMDSHIDERRDPMKSTEAAAKLLSFYYSKLKSWPLAITAYNHGSYGIQQAVKKTKSRDLGEIINTYKSPTFGFSSRNFYAEFVAILDILQDYKQYFAEIEILTPKKYDEFILKDYVKMKTLVKYSSLEEEDIIRHNPELRTSVLRSRRFLPKQYPLKVPVGMKEKLIHEYALIAATEKRSTIDIMKLHRVQGGQNLSSIAKLYNASVNAIIRANKIKDPNLLIKGQVLKVPIEA